MALVSVVESTRECGGTESRVRSYPLPIPRPSSIQPLPLIPSLGAALSHSLSNPHLERLERIGSEGRGEGVGEGEEEEPEDESPSSSDNSSKKSTGRPNRDPLSHRIIEKRRRDRMNNCLTNLSKLIPSAYLKKGRGRIEKTEIIEMAIRYMKQMQDDRRHPSPRSGGVKGGSSDKSVETDRPPEAPSSTSNQRGTLGPGFSELLQVATAGSFQPIQGSAQVRNSSNQLPPAHHQLVSRESLKGEEGGCGNLQPLNMSLKRPRLHSDSSLPSDSMTRKSSQLRDILTEAKDSGLQSSAFDPPKRPLVFRYNPPPQPQRPSEAEQQKIFETAKTMEGPALLLAAAEHNAGSSYFGPFHQRSPPVSMDGLSAGNSNSSSHYPSSPGSSSRSFSGGSTASYHGDSPPRVLSPPISAQQAVTPQNLAVPSPQGIPIFALHPSGFYYVPMTINAGQLDPSFVAQLTTVGNSARTPGACHPVTITVNFCQTNPAPPIQSLPPQQPSFQTPLPTLATGLSRPPWHPADIHSFNQQHTASRNLLGTHSQQQIGGIILAPASSSQIEPPKSLG